MQIITPPPTTTKLTKKHTQFSTKSAYLIIHVQQNNALQISSINRSQLNYEAQLQISPISQQNNKQLWIIDQVQHGMVQIANGHSDKVIWAKDDYTLSVRKGNGDKRHFWYLQQINGNLKINNVKYPNMYLAFDGVKKKPILRNKANDQWELRKVTQNQDLNRTCFIYEPKNQLFIDVPSSSGEQQVAICVWKPNYRFNQRWLLYKAGEVYIIKSLITGLNLDVFQQRYEDNDKIIQYHSNGGTNQFFMLEKLENHNDNQFRIYCFAQTEYELGHNGKLLKICKGRKFVWRIEGYIPQ